MKKLFFTLSLLITLSWSSALLAQADCLALKPEHAVADTDDIVCIDIKVENFQDVLGMQFSLRWNPDVLAFEEVKNFNLNQLTHANFGVPPSLPEYSDRIRFFWFDPGIIPQTLADDNAIFTICFQVIGQTGSHSPIVFDSDPTDVEVSVGSATEMAVAPAQLYSGSVTVGSSVPDLPELSLDLCPVIYSCSEVPPLGISPIVSGGTPDYTYAWSGPNGFTSSDLEITEPEAGTYILEVTDATGLSNTVTYDVVGASGNTLTFENIQIVQPTSCDPEDKGSIDFTVENGSGEYEYQWHDGVQTRTRTDLSSGIYTVTVTDLFLGCSQARSFTILPSGNNFIYRYETVLDVSCGTVNTGSIELVVDEEYSGTIIEWNTGATGSKITGLAPGQYSALVTTPDGCTFEWQGEVKMSDEIELSATVDYAACGVEDGFITLEVPGDPEDYTYLWDNGATTKDISGLSQGVYEVTVTHTSNGCSGTGKFNVWDGNMLTATNYDCIVEGQTLFAKVSAVVWDGGTPPYTFSWSNGVTDTDDLLSSVVISQPGSVTVTITDSKGCMEILDPIVPDCSGELGNTNFSTASNFECITDELGEETAAEITYTVWGGGTPPYTFTWSNGETTAGEQQSSVVVPADGQLFYYVTVTDQQGLSHVSNKLIPNCQLEGSPVTLDIGEGFVNQPGEAVCLPISVSNFEDIISMQFTMSWDPTQLVADSIINPALPDFTDKNYNLGPFANTDREGILIVAWSHSTFAGVTLPDGSSILEVCFTSIGDDDTAEVTFSQDPAIIEIGTNDEILPVIPKTGSVIRTNPTDKQVWPGDTDNNGLVDHFDLLNIGLAYGTAGYPRPDANLSWEAQFGAPWAFTTPNTDINYRHIDTDGNGTITANDTLALALNYRQYNDLWDGEDGFTERAGLPESARTTGTPLYIDTYPVAEGTMPVFNILLGDEANTENTVYGLAFSINYDPLAIVPGSIKMSFGDSWLGEDDESMLTFYRVDSQSHKVHVAMTRTDGLDITGSGAIAQLLITIEDVIFRSDNYEIPIAIENARLITAGEELVSVVERSSVITVETTTNTIDATLDRQIKIYPIPARDELYLTSPQLRIEAIELYDLEGRLLRSWSGQADRLPVNDLAQGTYAVRLITDRGVAVRRVVIMK